MLINHDLFDRVYDKIKDQSRRTETEVLVFAAMDCDAICAAVMMRVGAARRVIDCPCTVPGERH